MCISCAPPCAQDIVGTTAESRWPPSLLQQNKDENYSSRIFCDRKQKKKSGIERLKTAFFIDYSWFLPF
jgi:hypothetical protein